MSRANMLVRCQAAFEAVKKEYHDTRVPEFVDVEAFCRFIEDAMKTRTMSAGTNWMWRAYVSYCQEHHA